jgi:hypothetical protein
MVVIVDKYLVSLRVLHYMAAVSLAEPTRTLALLYFPLVCFAHLFFLVLHPRSLCFQVEIADRSAIYIKKDIERTIKLMNNAVKHIKSLNENADEPIKLLLLGKDQKIGPDPEKILTNLEKNGIAVQRMA